MWHKMLAVALSIFGPISPQKELGMNLGHVKLLSSVMFVVLIDWVGKLQVAEARHGV